MSYGCVGDAGTSVSSSGDSRSVGSFDRDDGRLVDVVARQVGESVRSSARHSRSSSTAKCATPLVSLCVARAAELLLGDLSCVTVFTTSGPVTNM